MWLGSSSKSTSFSIIGILCQRASVLMLFHRMQSSCNYGRCIHAATTAGAVLSKDPGRDASRTARHCFRSLAPNRVHVKLHDNLLCHCLFLIVKRRLTLILK